MAERSDRRQLKEQLQREVKRMEDAERKSPSVLAHTSVLGVLGLLIVVPVVAGAYLGQWVDRTWGDAAGRWTLALILTGVAVGAINVFLYLRR